MTKNLHTILMAVGAALLLCLPAFAVLAGIYAYSVPRQYYSKATLESRSTEPTAFLRALSAAAQPYRSSAEVREIRNTKLYEIGVYDTDPQQAAERANVIADTVQEKLKDDSIANAPPAVTIWERAEPSAHAARPNFPRIIVLGMAAGLLPALFGAVLLVIGFVTRANNPENPPQVA